MLAKIRREIYEVIFIEEVRRKTFVASFSEQNPINVYKKNLETRCLKLGFKKVYLEDITIEYTKVHDILIATLLLIMSSSLTGKKLLTESFKTLKCYYPDF